MEIVRDESLEGENYLASRFYIMSKEGAVMREEIILMLSTIVPIDVRLYILDWHTAPRDESNPAWCHEHTLTLRTAGEMCHIYDKRRWPALDSYRELFEKRTRFRLSEFFMRRIYDVFRDNFFRSRVNES